ncbi:hypothetical protein Cgig2_006611 [Carnegiea gigantea]|uniref:Uncharacterized protein n=1 Tax=Carnegiea gigantea TaxID=171969 RepID=A0A9Q1QLD5_9CARY|nr:hypothetical protein Cgig2_006611 [Carnegiea gigantea]
MGSSEIDTIMQQVSEQVLRAMEAANFARLLPYFDYIPPTGCEPSHHLTLTPSHCHSGGARETSRPEWNGWPPEENHDRSTTPKAHPSNHPSRERPTKSTTALMPYATHSHILMEVGERPMLKRPPPMTLARKPHNTRKYYEFYEQNDHTTAECRELWKALHELMDKGQIDCFLKRGPRFL